MCFAIVEVGIAKMLVCDANFHFVERVADVGGVEFVDAEGLRVVGLNGDECHATIAVVVSELLDALLVHLRDRAMVACENDDEDGARRIIGERMHFAIDTREREIRSQRARGKDRVSLLRGKEERKEKKDEKTERFQKASGISGR